MANEQKLALAALSSIPSIGPARLRWLLAERDPLEVFHDLQKSSLYLDASSAPTGVHQSMISHWVRHSRTLSLESIRARHESLGISIMTESDQLWPFHQDNEPPVVLFCLGDIGLLSQKKRVAIIGTRRCSSVGRTVAFTLGQSLGISGIAVVSGLALGIDGATHKGVLDVAGSAIGVVGTGLDVIYPKSNTSLWNKIAEQGLLLSENPLGAAPERWRFPARNRLIAGLVDALVVVESHRKGGSLLTVDEALDRDRMVMAVPGSILSPASEGSNALLSDGALPVTSAQEIIDAVGYTPAVGTNDSLEMVSDPSLENQWRASISSLGKKIILDVQAGDIHIDDLLLTHNVSPHKILAEIQKLVSEDLVVCDGSTLCIAPKGENN